MATLLSQPLRENEDAGSHMSHQEIIDCEDQEHADHLLGNILGEAVFQRPKKDVDEFPTKEDHVSILGEHEQPDVPEIRIDEIQR